MCGNVRGNLNNYWRGSFRNSLTQWGVGHGGFFTQTVRFTAYSQYDPIIKKCLGAFTIIYDCGKKNKKSSPSLEKAIDTFIDGFDGGKIDLLVISHFDEDHVNGLDYLSNKLKDKNITVSTVWAPILSDIEKIEIVETSTMRHNSSSLFLTFLMHPQNAIPDMFPGAHFIGIEERNEPIPLTPIVNEPDLPDNLQDINLTFGGINLGRALVQLTWTINKIPKSAPLWEICPFVNRKTKKAQTMIKNELERFLGKKLDRNQLTVKDLEKLIANKRSNKKNNSIVGHFIQSSNANAVSLCIYSAPVDAYRWCRNRAANGTGVEQLWAVPVAPAWLGTGDIPLRTRPKIDEIVEVYGKNRMDRIGIVSAPHHGSANNSSTQLWKSFPNLAIVTIEGCLKPAGKRQILPHQAVLDTLKQLHIYTHIAEDDRPFNWVDVRHR